MRKLGWSLVGLGFVAGLLSIWFGHEYVFLMAAFGLSFALGSLILLTSFGLRMYRGEVRLRLWDAAKMAAIFFLVVMCVRLVLGTFFFPNSANTLTDHFLASALVAIVLGLYQTAYRKPE